MLVETFTYAHAAADLQGYLVRDDAASPAPGVVMFPDFMGPHTTHVRDHAIRVASLGYRVLIADMFGLPAPPASREAAGALMAGFRHDRAYMRARARAALDALAAVSSVDVTRLASMGYCFGGGVSLELARSGAPLRGAVSLHGSLDTPHPEDARNITAKILALHGADDPAVTQEHVRGFVDEMRAAPVDWQLVQYGGAKHGFTNPNASASGSPAVAYSPDADRRSFAATAAFFAEVFA